MVLVTEIAAPTAAVSFLALCVCVCVCVCVLGGGGGVKALILAIVASIYICFSQNSCALQCRCWCR